MKAILVTGATSKVGRRLTERLLARDVRVKAATRKPDSLKKLHPDAEAVPFDYDEPDSWGPALDDVRAVFLTVPPLDAFASERVAPFVERMAAAGVQRVVLLSAFGANKSAEAPLAILENQLAATRFESIALRPNWFMENFTEGFFAPTITHQDAIFFAAGDGAVSFISADDIAAAAVQVLTKSSIPESGYDLTGAAAFRFEDVARLISVAAGREIVYHAISEQDQNKALLERGMTESSVAYMGTMCAAIQEGWAEPATMDLGKLTGSAGTTFADFVKQKAPVWQKP